ncbi:hypothetical protein QOZ80_4AG0317240 [Eleusine coracana subsp. coracana]|nr:hypothetical protein QOZ80_4AG0317240 [Eleusine coracana subsp. coracana]
MPSPYISSSPPAPSATRRRGRRRRHLLLSPFSAPASSSASSPASSTGLSLFSFSRSPSPFHHRFLSPLHASASASAVPFAWEHRPGVPKTPARQTRSSSSRSTSAKAQTPPLPLPPSRLLLHQGSKVGADDDYDFTIPNPDDDCFVVPNGGAKERLGRRRVRRQPALAAATLTDCLAVLSLCQSCTRSRDCLAGTPPPQRPRTMPRKAETGWSGYY